jgi:flagellar basal body P-ring formation protein FlgA
MIATLYLIGLAVTSGFANLDDTDRRVAAFVAEGGSGGSPQPVDRRLRLASCPQSLSLAWFGAERKSVLVKCATPARGWQIFVAVSGALPNANSTDSLGGPPLVQRGDEVMVKIVGDGFTVSRSAEALENGADGQWIKVRGNGGGPLRARVIGPGEVTISAR